MDNEGRHLLDMIFKTMQNKTLDTYVPTYLHYKVILSQLILSVSLQTVELNGSNISQNMNFSFESNYIVGTISAYVSLCYINVFKCFWA